MKIKEAIRLLQQQDPEADMCVYNHEFHSAEDATFLCTHSEGVFVFIDDAIRYMDRGLLPTEVTPESLTEQKGRIQYWEDEIKRTKDVGYAAHAERNLKAELSRFEEMKKVAARP